MLRIQGGTPISRKNHHKPNEPHRKRPPCPQCPQKAGADHFRPPDPAGPHAGCIKHPLPPPPLWNPKIGTERVFAPNQSISQTRKLRGECLPGSHHYLVDEQGQSPGVHTGGGVPDWENASLSFAAGPSSTLPLSGPEVYRPPSPPAHPAPACGVQNPHRAGDKAGGCGAHPSRVQPPLAALVPPPVGEGRGGPPLQQRCDSSNISGL